MELLDKDDPIKSQLLRKSEQHREDLEQDVRMVTERTQKVVTNALIIGGALALTYFMVRQFSGSTKKRKSKTRKIKVVSAAADTLPETESVEVGGVPGFVSQIGTALASQASVFLLSLAKEKLGEYLESQAEKKESK
jgi:hypothetical protein